MSLNSSIALRIRATLITVADLVTQTSPLTLDFNDELGSGFVADTADLVFSDTRTLGASGTENLDLQGSLLMANGAAFLPVVLKMIFISAAAGNTNDVNVAVHTTAGVPFLDPADAFVAIKPGGCHLQYAPGLTGICAVVATTADLITVTNSAGGTSVTYSIILIGTSA